MLDFIRIDHAILIPSGYLTVRHGKSPFLIGKPSISIRAMAEPWRTVSHNQRVHPDRLIRK